MAKKLKLCFAMGGGVSLGAFSGAALTEALKLLIIDGRDMNGDRYEEVILDGMSGASAGSISLSILMRVLIDYKPYLEFNEVKAYFGQPQDASKSDVLNAVKSSLGAQYSDKIGDKIDVLIPVEVAQAVQHAVWVHELHIKGMLSQERLADSLDAFSLMGKYFLFDIAKKYLLDPLEDGINLENKVVLSDRVLMAFSMANLSPSTYSDNPDDLATDDPSDDKDLIKTLQTATRIYNHNELRVFDFNFGSREKIISENLDSKYITFFSSTDAAPQDFHGIQYTTESIKGWSEIAASAMASGAFPLAFQPVLLNRYIHEYKNADELTEREKEKKSSTMFAYADGGAFNNEPIKEAFKLGYFQDFQNGTLDVDSCERLVLFVDPSVPDQVRYSQLSSLDMQTDLDDKFKASVKGEFAKCTGVISDLAGMIIRQSKINEEANVKQFYKTALLKRSISQYLKESSKYNFEAMNQSELVKNFEKRSKNYLRDRYLSIGTRDVGRMIYKKYVTVCKDTSKVCLSAQGFDEVIHMMSAKERAYSTQEIKEFLREKGCDDAHHDVVAQAIMLTITEFSLNQSGKSEVAQRAGIFPIDDGYEIEKLPGSELSAFAGFASEPARKACFYKGRVDAIRCLSNKSFRKYHQESIMVGDGDYSGFIGTDGEEYSLNTLMQHYKGYKDLYEKEIDEISSSSLRDLLINRLESVVENMIKGNRFKIFFGSFLSSKSILKKIINKETLSDLITQQANIPLKITTTEDRIKVLLPGNKKVWLYANTFGGIKIIKLYINKRLDNNTLEFSVLSHKKAWQLKALSPIREISFGGQTYPIKKLEEALRTGYDSLFYEINPVCHLSTAPDGKLKVEKFPVQKDFATQLYAYKRQVSTV